MKFAMTGSSKQAAGALLQGGKRVLLVEDDPDLIEVTALALAADGHTVSRAQDAESALDAFRWSRVDVAIIDIGLPAVDGYELARRLRATERGARMLLLAMTGRDGCSDRQRARDAGFDAQLVKPVDLAMLRRALDAEPVRGSAPDAPTDWCGTDAGARVQRASVSSSGAGRPDRRSGPDRP